MSSFTFTEDKYWLNAFLIFFIDISIDILN